MNNHYLTIAYADRFCARVSTHYLHRGERNERDTMSLRERALAAAEASADDGTRCQFQRDLRLARYSARVAADMADTLTGLGYPLSPDAIAVTCSPNGTTATHEAAWESDGLRLIYQDQTRADGHTAREAVRSWSVASCCPDCGGWHEPAAITALHFDPFAALADIGRYLAAHPACRSCER